MRLATRIHVLSDLPEAAYWQCGKARKATLLIDAASYFAALREALRRAKHQVILLGWCFDTRTVLVPDARGQGPTLLECLTEASERASVHMLGWDAGPIYWSEREVGGPLKTRLASAGAVHFALDGSHTSIASHHQKIVVVDDEVAFCGGMDITGGRWDTPGHLPEDGRRKDCSGRAHGPVHDVQWMLQGEPARALGELARLRWLHATDHVLPPPRRSRDFEVASVSPELTWSCVEVAISRTMSAYGGISGVQEVLALHEHLLSRAQRYVYVENQFLTSVDVVRLLSERLEAARGPDIVLCLPYEESKWLEQATMGRARAEALARLSEADRHGRLAVFSPVAANGAPVGVHSKLCIVDDAYVRAGSANLSNRSMGLDTECDVTLVCESAEHRRKARVALARLVAEHAGAESTAVAARIHESGLTAAVRGYLQGKRVVLPVQRSNVRGAMALARSTWDLDRPPIVDRAVEELAPVAKPRNLRHWFVWGAFGFVMLALVAVWRFTPLSAVAEPGALAEILRVSSSSPWSYATMVGVMLVASLLMVPVTVLVATNGLLLGTLAGSIVSLIGCVLSAAFTYALGRRFSGLPLPRTVVSLGSWMRKRGVRSVVALRMVPVAPFTVVNFFLGRANIELRAVLLGTLLGMAPGVLALSYVGDNVRSWLSGGDVTALLVAGIVIVVILLVGHFLSRRFSASRSNTQP